jgi:hypothetical protein
MALLADGGAQFVGEVLGIDDCVVGACLWVFVSWVRDMAGARPVAAFAADCEADEGRVLIAIGVALARAGLVSVAEQAPGRNRPPRA